MKPITNFHPNEPTMREQFERIQELRNEAVAVHQLAGADIDRWVQREYRAWMSTFVPAEELPRYDATFDRYNAGEF